jgi:hypothetical protein
VDQGGRTGRVTFRARDEEIALLDVARGPCVDRVGPRGGRRRPLASPFDQWPDGIEQMEALFRLIARDPSAEPWAGRQTKGPGTLCRYNGEFTEGLLEIWRAREATEAEDDDDLRPYREVAGAWLSPVSWPHGQQVGGLLSRLVVDVGNARLTQEQGQGLYCWFGPLVPEYVLVSGVGEKSYEEYRRAKRAR